MNKHTWVKYFDDDKRCEQRKDRNMCDKNDVKFVLWMQKMNLSKT